MLRFARTATLFATAASLPLAAARADEGMWTFDAFPAAKMRAAYGFAPDQAWLDKVSGAAVRLTGGCSASFVSNAGLILTNHHCVAPCLQDLSTAARDLHKNGIVTRARAAASGSEAAVANKAVVRAKRSIAETPFDRAAEERMKKGPTQASAPHSSGCERTPKRRGRAFAAS